MNWPTTTRRGRWTATTSSCTCRQNAARAAFLPDSSPLAFPWPICRRSFANGAAQRPRRRTLTDITTLLSPIGLTVSGMAEQSYAIDAGHPPSALLRLVNPMLGFLLRTPLAGPARKQLMVLSFTGRKSGRPYSHSVECPCDRQ